MDYSKSNIDSDNIIRIFVLLMLLILPTLSYSQVSNSTKYKINSVSVKGNKAFSDKELKKNINISKSWWLFGSNRLTKRMIISDRLIIKTFYLKNGFLNATVRDSIFINEKQKVDVFFFVDEGEQYFLNDIKFSGNTLFDSEYLLDKSDIKIGKPYNPIDVRKTKTEIQGRYENKGKPLVMVRDSLEIIDNNINLLFMINENKTMQINNILISNNKDVEDHVIRRELDFHKGDIYSKKKIENSKRYLLNLGLFSTVNINFTNIDTIKNNIDLMVYVRESDMRYWEVNTGFVQEEGTGAEINNNWNINANWRHKNITNKARALGIGAEYGINLSDVNSRPDFSGEINYTEPWLFKLRSTTLFRLFIDDIDNKGYDYTKYGFETAFIINPDKRNYLKTGIEISGIDNKYLDVDSIMSNITERERAQERAVFLNYTRDRRNDFLNPSKGHYFTFTGKITSSMVGGSEDYFKLETSYSEYFRIFKKLTFAYRGRVGYIAPYGNDKNAPEYEKYYLGGSNTMRGWENQKFITQKTEDGNIILVRKRLKVLTNFELRFPIYWLIGGELFVDGGNLVSDIPSLRKEPYRWNYGFGLTVATPLGPARVDYARPVSNRDEKWILQFAISYAF